MGDALIALLIVICFVIVCYFLLSMRKKKPEAPPKRKKHHFIATPTKPAPTPVVAPEYFEQTESSPREYDNLHEYRGESQPRVRDLTRVVEIAYVPRPWEGSVAPPPLLSLPDHDLHIN